MLKNYCKTAWRNITRQRLTSTVNISGLAIAMTAVVMIVIWVQNEQTFDSYHPDADRIYLVKNNWQIDKNPTWVEENSFYPMGAMAAQSVPEAETVTKMLKEYPFIISVNGRPFKQATAIEVDKNWFTVFKYQFIKGNANTFFNSLQNVIITQSKAMLLFGSVNLVGQHLAVDSTLYNISAVIADNPLNSTLQFDVIMPDKGSDAGDWQYMSWKTFIKLKPLANKAFVENKLAAIVKANSKAEGTITPQLLPLKSLHFAEGFTHPAFKHGSSKTTGIFIAFAALLLLAAAVNYVNMSVARTGIRVKEICIRKINGASRLNLFIQMMAESVIASAVAMVLTIGLVYACFPLLKSFTGIAFIFNPFNKVTICILAGVLVSIVLLTGIYPAILLSSFKPISIFSGRNILGVKTSLFKKVLVTAQFTLAAFMVVAAITVYKQLSFIQTQQAGYNREQLFTVKVPDGYFPFGNDFRAAMKRQDATLEALKQELLTHSAIKAVSRMDIASPVNEGYTISGGLDWDGKPNKFEPQYVSYAVDADMYNIMHYTMAAGRWFNRNNLADKNNIVLNETAVKLFNLQQPVVGKRFKNGVIIGVVKDFYHQSLHEKIAPLVIETNKPLASAFAVQANGGSVTAALDNTKQLWKKYFPGCIFEYSFADDDFADMYKNDRNALTFTIVFSGLSILICCMGLLAMTIFMAEQRRREIGIRKVLGATVAGLAALVSKDFIKLVLMAIVIASPVAWWCMHLWLQDYAYRITINAWVFVLAGVVVICLAILTIAWQALKAAKANPVASLREQ